MPGRLPAIGRGTPERLLTNHNERVTDWLRPIRADLRRHGHPTTQEMRPFMPVSFPVYPHRCGNNALTPCDGRASARCSDGAGNAHWVWRLDGLNSHGL